MIASRLFLSHPGAACNSLKALLIALPVLLGGISPATLASDEERWFQVELIAFARRTADGGEEHWPQNVQLRYPSRWQELKDPSAAEAPEEAPATEPDSGDRRTQRDSSEPFDPLLPRLVRMPDLAHDAYYLLPESDRQLKRHADALQRDSRYRVLFHQSWRQPVLEQTLAPALLISGGDAYGSHYELEGSILLYLSRFLHLQTQLWFSEFEVNYGQRPDAWPILPLHPAQVQAPAPESITATGDALSGFTLGTADTWNIDLGSSYLSDVPSSLGEPYLPKRIVTLQQSRRMRSDELHYIDHPLIGLIVQITPYERPEAE